MISSAPLLAAFQRAAQKPTICCDIDGVLAFTNRATLTALNARFGTDYTLASMKQYAIAGWLPPEQSEWIDGQFSRPEFYATVAPDFHAIDGLRALYLAGYYVMVASDRPVETTAVTQSWLADAGVLCTELRVGPGMKANIAGQYGAADRLILIDDNPQKMLLARDGVEVWLPRKPWTSDVGIPFTFIFDEWSEVTARLTEE